MIVASLVFVLQSVTALVFFMIFDLKLSVSDRNNNWPSMHGETMVALPSRMKRQCYMNKSSYKKAGFNASPKVGLVSKLGNNYSSWVQNSKQTHRIQWRMSMTKSRFYYFGL